jgi:cytochrome d ubiquinol oxidase subunit II
MIFRGTAFTFRRYDSKKDVTQERWGMIFSISSLFTPIVLGIILGAITQGHISVNLYNYGHSHPSAHYSFYDLYVKPWTSPFCFAVGLFALVLFSFLAAVYLSTFAESEQLKEDFRKRAIVSQFVCAALALIVFLLADFYVPPLKEALLHSSWSAPVQAITAVSALSSLYFLFRRRYIWARTAAALQVTFILWGWGLAQYPYLIRPELTIQNAAGARSTQELLVFALGFGAFVLIPSFVLLFKVFKHDRDHVV